jgi:hypothetical protein
MLTKIVKILISAIVQVNEVVRPLVLSICNNLKKYNPDDKEHDTQDYSTALVKLYFNLKYFNE